MTDLVSTPAAFIAQIWYGFWIRLAYALGLRTAVIDVQRWFLERDAPRAKLPTFDTPWALEKFLVPRFEWRKDSGRLGGVVFPLDWISCPEVFWARLLDTDQVGDGDCDDVHYAVAVMLSRMTNVTCVRLLSTGYLKPWFWKFRQQGGHTTCVFRYNGRWWHFNYGITEIDDPNAAPLEVARRHGDIGWNLWHVWEYIEPRFKPAAICPATLTI